MLTDGYGNRFTPPHAVRSDRRYRYYVSAAPITETGADRVQVRRLAAQEVEGAVIRMLVEALTSPARLLERFGTGSVPADQIRRMLGRAACLAVAFSSSPRDRAKPVRGLVEKVKAAMATFAGPMVRIRLPPAESLRTIGPSIYHVHAKDTRLETEPLARAT